MNPTFVLKARVDHVQLHEGAFYHVVTTPAPDAYSKPSRYKLRSKDQLGTVGAEITVDVTVSGSVYEKNYRDKQTGINKVFHEANVYMDASPVNINRLQQPAAKSA